MKNKTLSINEFYDMYSKNIEQICRKYNYNENISHLVSFMIILFLINYDSKYEKIIISCFENIEIIINDKYEKNIEAFYYRKLYNDGNYYTKKYIVINNFIKENYIDLIDSIIHEFNHAINSIKNEIKTVSNYVLLRAGVCFIKYNCDNLNVAVEKSKEFVLEEVINTIQTEEIINTILEINTEYVNNLELNGIINGLQMELKKQKFKSKAYSLESVILDELIKNRTFINTVKELRIAGEVEQIEDWFDSITKINGSYNKLNQSLRDIIALEERMQRSKISKIITIKKIRREASTIRKIVGEFNKNCNYV